MKAIFAKLFFIVLFLSACTVDDYTDANPPRQLDGPAGFVKTIGGDAIIDFELNTTTLARTTYIFVPVNGTVSFDVDVVDAPGLIDSVSAISSKELGEFNIDLLEAKGKGEGMIKVEYTAGSVFSSGASTAGNETISVSIFDAQNPQKVSSAVRPAYTVKTVNATCFVSKPLAGTYDAVTSGYDSETGANYSNLEAVVELRINAGGTNHPGLYRLTDGSFGLYPEQGFAGNFINITVCDNNVTNANEEFTDLFSGTLNSDGTITITWSNTFGDTGVTVLTPR